MSHHAYLLPQKLAMAEAKDFILSLLQVEREKMEWKVWEAGNFKVEHAREVKEALTTKPYEGMTRIVMLSFSTMNPESQNALLKAIEEPGENTIFFLMTDSPDRLLPTIHSRIERIALTATVQVGTISSIAPKSIKDALKQAGKIVDDIKEEKVSKDEAVTFIDSLIMLARDKKKPVEIVAQLLKLRSYLLDQSASIKQVLESAIALSF